MDFTLFLHAIIMGLVEGITEFLPISSTGHLILTGELLNFWTPQKRELFAIAVQIGAISAVVYEYWGKLWGAFTGFFKGDRTSQRLCINLVVASLPIVIIGLSFGESIKAVLFNVHTVAMALIVGGFIILWVEKRQRTKIDHPISSSHSLRSGDTVDTISFKQAVIIGFLQCLALIPGTSRSGATIIGGLSIGMSRKAAAEFSFFLGIPVLMGAGMFDLFRQRHSISLQPDVLVLLTGIIIAFISALLVIRVLIQYVSKHDFTVFAWYRIVFGLVVLISAQYINW